MEKRTLFAIILSILILLGWDYFVIQPRVPDEAQPTQEQVLTRTEPAPEAKPLTSVTPLPRAEQGRAEIVKVETPLYHASFSSRGGRLISLRLNQYHETMDADAPGVELIQNPMPNIALDGGFQDSGLDYEPSLHGDVDLSEGTQEITFSARAGEGLVIRKIFTLDAEGYGIGFRTVVENLSDADAALNMDIILERDFPADKKGSRYTFEGPVLLNGKHLEEFKISKVKKVGGYRQFTGPIHWFGYENKYFLETMIPITPEETNVTIQRRDTDLLTVAYSMPVHRVSSGQSLSQDFLLYVGPKEYKTLKEVNYGLSKALDFGFFDIIAKPLLRSMNWIQQYTNSYGWAIIILTIIIKFLLYPLSLKSFTSMKEMQKVQPLMKELQTKYANDKEKLNQEMMKLYSEHKINPMGGCLPMLLQIPILFALYRVFLSAIELRHTPFHIFGTWLPDLSARDPYFITPILMGLSQFLMQKMTPQAGDPTQQKMMMIMPFIFTFMFLNFPSGLVLYWLISNTLSIIQQAYINRRYS